MQQSTSSHSERGEEAAESAAKCRQAAKLPVRARQSIRLERGKELVQSAAKKPERALPRSRSERGNVAAQTCGSAAK